MTFDDLMVKCRSTFHEYFEKKKSAKNMAQNCNFLSKKYFDLKSRFDELLNFSPIKVNFENFRPKTVIFGFFAICCIKIVVFDSKSANFGKILDEIHFEWFEKGIPPP